ncbi:MAG: hypothetical protein QM607_08395 [Microbacterium sp.]
MPGWSWHPKFGAFQVTGGALPDGTAIPSFTTTDERYTHLKQLGERTWTEGHRALFASLARWVTA